MKNIKALLSITILSLSLIGCQKEIEKDIVILYTSDVHCGIDNNIGYDSLSAYKKQLEKDNYVTLMDSGDNISGDFIGAVSKGEYIIDIMNEVGYDSMIFGNHEFDYGMDVLSERVNQFKGDVLSCNFKYIGNKENKFNDVKPYKIIKYGKKKIGYVGVTTPYTIVDSTPAYFKEDDKFAYSFTADSAQEFYSCVQDNIDACYKEKADYVIVLAHLGEGEEYEPYSSMNLINNTKGVTAILDGHSHKTISHDVKDKEGKNVPLLETGYQMSEIGQLTIKQDRTIESKLIDKIDEKDSSITELMSLIHQKTDEIANQVVATSDVALSIYGPEGTRMIRTREMPIGNLVADAYRLMSDAQIAFTNGGGIRADLKEGDITFSDIKAVHPFGNHIDVAMISGQQLADYLEFASCKAQKEYYQKQEDGSLVPFGENGGFAHVSGIKYSIDTSIPSSVKFDEKGMFIKVDGPRRVKDILVLENGNYVPLKMEQTYRAASHNYYLEEYGDGANMFKGSTIIKKDLMLDYECLVKYIVEVLKGQLKDKYSQVEGRITIL
ncbi:MAG: bifunctional metallophosphatase/5'-nucleotidase [Bacilli bacterium]|nr:bifunctional metallophosphatase/5'-nucleotidase [Bacilli bacterium]